MKLIRTGVDGVKLGVEEENEHHKVGVMELKFPKMGEFAGNLHETSRFKN